MWLFNPSSCLTPNREVSFNSRVSYVFLFKVSANSVDIVFKGVLVIYTVHRVPVITCCLVPCFCPLSMVTVSTAAKAICRKVAQGFPEAEILVRSLSIPAGHSPPLPIRWLYLPWFHLSLQLLCQLPNSLASYCFRAFASALPVVGNTPPQVSTWLSLTSCSICSIPLSHTDLSWSLVLCLSGTSVPCMLYCSPEHSSPLDVVLIYWK